MNINIFVIFAVIIAVKAWPCVSPIRKVFSRVNTDAVLQFSADLTNLNSPIQFDVRFFDNSFKARITYYPDRSPTTDVLPGLNITGDTDGTVVVTLPNIQENDTGFYILTSPGTSLKCNSLYMLGRGIPKKPTVTVNKTPSVGESAILTCSSTSTTTPSYHSLSLKYSWRVNNIENPTSTKYSYTPSKDKLTVSNILKEDANKQFTCTASEDVTDGYTSNISELFSFDVHYGPDLVSVNVTSPYVLTEGEIMSIECTADCYPGCTYTWINVTSGEVINSNDETLYIESVDKYMTGDYQCKAENTGFPYSKSADVIVSVNIKDLHSICSEVSKEGSNCGSIVAIAIVCGVLTVIVTTYAASITILWKRNVSINKNRRTTVTKTDKDSVIGSTQQQHYANVAYTTNDQDIQGQVLGTDDSSKTQYTDLDDFSREKRDNLYDAIKRD
ncbi:carcinoembryonic antigen-related cell adhesion molecule 6-like [Ruditapes philippinarum]|uniref:carcinoembryonic antigen-related cell adhesion molecule 6-like n=1 Tax=Ruditapes philippinarum TaxID=129788 RepID=UPI00295BD6C5|nr:carcinoembryonic antigen-related cell adhesion molecule 6-like [Ruditapes philippinarum]